MAQLGDDRRPLNPILAPADGDVFDPSTGSGLSRAVAVGKKGRLASVEPRGNLDPVTGVPILDVGPRVGGGQGGVL